MIRFILNRLVTLAGLLFLLSVITFWVNVRIYGIDLRDRRFPSTRNTCRTSSASISARLT